MATTLDTIDQIKLHINDLEGPLVGDAISWALGEFRAEHTCSNKPLWIRVAQENAMHALLKPLYRQRFAHCLTFANKQAVAVLREVVGGFLAHMQVTYESRPHSDRNHIGALRVLARRLDVLAR